MNDAELERRFQEMLAAARERCDSVEELHKRWNRVCEAIDPVCEDTIFLLDRIGRGEQADDIHSHMSLEERYDLLLDLFRTDAAALRAESEAAGLLDDFRESAFFLDRFSAFVDEERQRQQRG